MKKWGLIGAGVMFLLAIVASVISPICVPCMSLLVGLAVGYFAANSDQPRVSKDAVKIGTLAALITAAGTVLGQLAGSVIGALITSDEMLMASMAAAWETMRQMGYEVYGNMPTIEEVRMLKWPSFLGTGCCVGIVDVAMLAGFGALGGVLWWQITGKEAVGTEVIVDLRPEPQEPPDITDAF